MARILGLDPGQRRIGVAVSDPTGTIASPHGFVDVAGRDPVADIADLCRELAVGTIVIGLPVGLDGIEGPAAEAARVLGETLSPAIGLPIEYHDERFTTVIAEEALIEGGVRRIQRKTKRDQVAAAVMLQSYLDKRARDGRDGSGNPDR